MRRSKTVVVDVYGKGNVVAFPGVQVRRRLLTPMQQLKAKLNPHRLWIVDRCLDSGELSDWELRFCASLLERPAPLTERQAYVLDRICRKVGLKVG